MNEERRQFQVDRIAYFSDAVIAIAITLLILQVKLPPLGSATTWGNLKAHIDPHMGSSLTGMFICFIAIGNLWMLHHELYQHVRNYNQKLVQTNLYFLLAIMVLPLSTGFLFEGDNPAFVSLPIFFLNLGLCYLTYFIMMRVILHPKNNFAAFPSKLKRRSMQWHSLGPAFVFLVAAVLAALGYTHLKTFGPIFVAYALAARLTKIWEDKQMRAEATHKMKKVTGSA